LNCTTTDLVKEQHEVDAESDGQSNELHGEEVSCQEADNSLGVSAEVDGRERGGLGLCCLGLGQLLCRGHGGKLSGPKVFRRCST